MTVFGLSSPGSNADVALYPEATAPPSDWEARRDAADTTYDITRDVDSQRLRYVRELTAEIERNVPPSRAELARREADLGLAQRQPITIAEVAMARAREAFAGVPDSAIPDIPLTRAQFEAEIDRRERRDYLDAQDVLANAPAGSWGAELAGQAWAGATDPLNLALMPLGGASGGILRVLGTEALLGAVAEGATLPGQYEAADRLGIEGPHPVRQMAEGAAFGAGLAGAGMALGGAIRGGTRLAFPQRFPRRPGDVAVPEGVSPLDHEFALDDAEEALITGAAAPGARPGNVAPAPEAGAAAPPPGAPPAFDAFDFSAAGNASPQTNRAGYIFGRLLAEGMEPEVAAGFVGNFMVESGAALNTNAVGDGGRAFGIAQWNDRRPALLAFARSRGTDPADLDTQIAFVMHELRGSEASAWAAIQRAGSAEEAARLVSELYERPGEPHLGRRTAYASDIFDQYQGGAVPRWRSGAGGAVTTGDAGPTTRGYTAEGQLRYGDDARVDVRYEVVDASLLRQASGDLQPRDRAHVRSDLWVSQTAADLDPALLLPAPTADRGAPLVGPDGIIESGNGRVRVIERAYDQHPDRAAAYRSALQEAGYTIPEGVERPVLIARRTSELTDAERQHLVVAAQDSGVAQLTAAERAGASRAALSPETLALYDPAAPLRAPENRAFARRFVESHPPSQQGAMIAADKGLSSDGVRALRDAVFARAWEAPDILARFIEEEPGELRTLLDGLAQAAPAFARLRALIEAGDVLPEMDISPFVIDAARLIVAARDLAAREGKAAAAMLDELMAEVDLFGGAVAPLTQALVRVMMPGGKQAPAARIAAFLTRYADEAAAAGRTGDMLGAATPLEVLARIEPEIFGTLTETGAARARRPEPAPPRLDSPALDGAGEPGTPAAREIDGAMERGLRAELAPARRADPAEAADSATRAAMREQIATAPALADLEFAPVKDGPMVRLGDYLDDLDADAQLIAVLDACTMGGTI